MDICQAATGLGKYLPLFIDHEVNIFNSTQTSGLQAKNSYFISDEWRKTCARNPEQCLEVNSK